MRRHTEDWLAAVFASATSARARDAAYAMSTYADWDTGHNCWASAETLAKRVRRGRRTLQRGIDELEALGFIQRTGIKRPHNCTDYALVIPAAVSSAKVDASTSAKVDASDFSQLRQFGQSVAPNQAISCAKVGAQPPHTSSDPKEEEEDEESACAPAPQGAALALDGADAPPVVDPIDYTTAVRAIEGQLRQQWPKRIGFRITGKSRAGLRALIDAGWNVPQLLALVAECGQPKSNAGGLLAAHFAKALQEYDRDDYTPAPILEDVSTFVDIRDQADELTPTCKHGTPLDLLAKDGHGCNYCAGAGFIMLPLNEGAAAARMKAVVADAKANGWDATRLGNGTYRLTHPRAYIEFDLDQAKVPEECFTVCLRKPSEDHRLALIALGAGLSAISHFDDGDVTTEIVRDTTEETIDAMAYALATFAPALSVVTA